MRAAKLPFLLTALAALNAGPTLPAFAGGHDHATPAAAAGTRAATSEADLARMMTLAGTWTGKSATGHNVRQTLEAVSNGSTLLERFLDEGNPKFSNMVTMYYLDGDRLVLTHYCSVPNQPHMIARAYDAERKELVFECASGGNMKSHDDGHMHRALYRFETPDRIVTEWTFQNKSKDAFTEVLTLTRQTGL